MPRSHVERGENGEIIFWWKRLRLPIPRSIGKSVRSTAAILLNMGTATVPATCRRRLGRAGGRRTIAEFGEDGDRDRLQAGPWMGGAATTRGIR